MNVSNVFLNIVFKIMRRILKITKFGGHQFFLAPFMIFFRYIPSVYGPLMYIRPKDYTNRASISGNYGCVVYDQIQKLSKNDIFIDVGANAGIFSLVASDRLVDGYVFSFEPNRKIFTDLCKNIDLNNKSNIIAINIALSDDNEIVIIPHKERHSGSASLLEWNEDNKNNYNKNGNNIVVSMNPENLKFLFDVIKNRRVGIKIDVEGYEFKVLRGLHMSGIFNLIEWVIVEINENNLMEYNSTINDLYEFMILNEFIPRFGVNYSNHYDEVFISRNSESYLYTDT